MYIRNNIYVGGSQAYAKENGAHVYADGSAEVVADGAGVFVNFDLPEGAFEKVTAVLTGSDLEPARFVGLGFSDRDGSELTVDRDINGVRSSVGAPIPAGPLVDLSEQVQSYQVW